MFNYRAYIIAITASIGAFLFGYDTGFIGGAVNLPSFERDFGITPQNRANTSANIVATLQAGCFFGTVAMSIGAKYIGRTRALGLASFVFLIGAIVQCVTASSVGVMYGGRIIAGLGIGASSMLVPSYVAEIAPRFLRGKLTTFYAFMLYFSIMVSYWVDYGCKLGLPATGFWQWRVPIILQVVPGVGLLVGSLFLKESPRWLITRGRNEEALKNLAYVNMKKVDHPDIIAEYSEIFESSEQELRETEGASWKELFNPRFRNQAFICFLIMLCQQLTGTIAFTYYAPQLFQSVGLSSTSSSLFATGIYGIVKVVAAMISLFFVVDKVGRRVPLIIGALVMGTCLLILAILNTTKPPSDNGGVISGASIAMMVMIYLYVIGFASTWGPIPFAVISEICPNRIRGYSVGIGLATQWAFNYALTRTIPLALSNIGWRTFLMLSIWNYSLVLFTLFVIRETKHYPLEEIEELFTTGLFLPWRQALKIRHEPYDNSRRQNLDDADREMKENAEHIEKARVLEDMVET
ncbi:general substrate transporter [Lipomyces arxii]|uniref:general substrate transporter n=1 Tax=Lipomyces arxii TaxID=56418 RepID=UPI0034CDA172